MRPNSHSGVKHENTLLGPREKVTVCGTSKSFNILFQFCVHVAKTGRDFDTWLYRKTKSMRLSVIVVGIFKEGEDEEICKENCDLPCPKITALM